MVIDRILMMKVGKHGNILKMPLTRITYSLYLACETRSKTALFLPINNWKKEIAFKSDGKKFKKRFVESELSLRF